MEKLEYPGNVQEETMKINRRDLLAASAGLAGAAGLGLTGGQPAFAQEPAYTPEAGASLRLLRWSPFVKGDEDAWLANNTQTSWWT